MATKQPKYAATGTVDLRKPGQKVQTFAPPTAAAGGTAGQPAYMAMFSDPDIQAVLQSLGAPGLGQQGQDQGGQGGGLPSAQDFYGNMLAGASGETNQDVFNLYNQVTGGAGNVKPGFRWDDIRTALNDRDGRITDAAKAYFAAATDERDFQQKKQQFEATYNLDLDKFTYAKTQDALQYGDPEGVLRLILAKTGGTAQDVATVIEQGMRPDADQGTKDAFRGLITTAGLVDPDTGEIKADVQSATFLSHIHDAALAQLGGQGGQGTQADLLGTGGQGGGAGLPTEGSTAPSGSTWMAPDKGGVVTDRLGNVNQESYLGSMQNYTPDQVWGQLYQKMFGPGQNSFAGAIQSRPHPGGGTSYFGTNQVNQGSFQGPPPNVSTERARFGQAFDQANPPRPVQQMTQRGTGVNEAFASGTDWMDSADRFLTQGAKDLYHSVFGW